MLGQHYCTWIPGRRSQGYTSILWTDHLRHANLLSSEGEVIVRCILSTNVLRFLV